MQQKGTLLLFGLLLGCSAERNNAVSRTWHTFVSYFNGYYHAEQRFRLAQQEIEMQTPDPTEGFIRVYPLIDPAIARSHYTRLEEAGKKCEVIIFRHKNGKYIDDSRSLIGQSWVLRSNLPNAELNFNYVLSAFPNTPLRPKIYWWQAYAALHEENPYRAETRLTDALSLPAKLLRKYKPHIDALLAQTLIAKGQPELARPFLERSCRHLDTRLRRARAFYLLGQLYLHENKPELAASYFRKAYRLNATNALTFQSQLQLSLIQSGQELRFLKRLERMARSARYEDYRDQIYYRIGQIHAQKGNYEAALAAYRRAGSTGQSSARALAHYEAGLIYFEKFNDFSSAQKHFDTAASLIPEKHPKSLEVKSLQARFKEYATLREKLHWSDSLLQLAEMSPEERERRIEAYIRQEVLRRATEKANRQREQAVASASPPNPFIQQSIGGGGRASGFYFDNPIQVSSGRQEFIRLWGERPDEDHWRRRNKSSLSLSAREALTEKRMDTPEQPQWPEDLADLTPQKVQALKRQLLSTVPTTPAQKRAVEDTLIETALSLAQVYVEAFGRQDSAEKLYHWLQHRLPHRSDAQVIALYGLYALHIGTPQAEPYKKELLTKYPQSEYAKLLNTGGKTLTTTPILDIHQALLENYYNEEYLSVVGFGEATQEKWKGTPSEPSILYLMAAAYVHLEQVEKAIPLLRRLIQSYPQASCTPLAQKLLQRLEKGQTQLVAEAQPEKPPAPPSSSPHGFSLQHRQGEAILVILLVPKEKISSETLKQYLARAHEQQFSQQRLSMTVFLYNNTHHLAYVAQFSDYRAANAYIQVIENEPWFMELGVHSPQDFFPISQTNFRVAFTQRRMHEYAAFFAQNRESFR
ncbi:MAG: tetratricopeptide repeat protein [Bacteroidia bacterium]|nr:tetratricopeptide repeat protein [Bacteroidia bacterium]